jgi:hypothetical protein
VDQGRIEAILQPVRLSADPDLLAGREIDHPPRYALKVPDFVEAVAAVLNTDGGRSRARTADLLLVRQAL